MLSYAFQVLSKTALESDVKPMMERKLALIFPSR